MNNDKWVLGSSQRQSIIWTNDCLLDPWKIIGATILMQGNEFEIGVCKMSPILSGPQCGVYISMFWVVLMRIPGNPVHYLDAWGMCNMITEPYAALSWE